MAPTVAGLYYVSASQKPQWKKKANFIDRFGVPVSMLLEFEESKMIGLPRTWAEPGYDDMRIKGEYIHPTKIAPVPRNAEQIDLQNKLEEHISLKGYGGTIVAPTGFGKTWLGCIVIQAIGKTTLVVTTKTDEMENWVKHCHDMLGIEAQRWHGNNIPDEDAEIVVGLVQSIAKGPTRYGFDIYDRFGLVIFDECHRLSADFFVQACGHLAALWRFGMTATPERIDGKERVFRAHIGRTIVEAVGLPMTPKVYLVPSKFKLPVKVVKGKVRTVEPTAGRSSWVDKALRKNKHRNDQLIKLIELVYMRKRKTVIFSGTKEHLEYLYTNTEVPISEKGFYWGGLSHDKLGISAAKPLVYATYAMGGQGTNFPWWDCLILATPLANVKQVIGRILREFPDKKIPVIFDMQDPGYIWGAYGNKRKKLYEAYGSKTQIIDI